MARGDFVANITLKKIMEVGYWWPTLFKDTHVEAMTTVKKLED